MQCVKDTNCYKSGKSIRICIRQDPEACNVSIPTSRIPDFQGRCVQWRVEGGPRSARRVCHPTYVARRVPVALLLFPVPSVSPGRPPFPCSVGVQPHGSALSPAMYGLALTTCSRPSHPSRGVSRSLFVDHLCRHCSCVPAHPSSYCLPEPTPGIPYPWYMRCSISPPNHQLHLTHNCCPHPHLPRRSIIFCLHIPISTHPSRVHRGLVHHHRNSARHTHCAGAIS